MDYLVFISVTLLFVLCIFGIFILVPASPDYSDGQKANIACRTHQGVRSMSTNQFNELNIVCRDGYAVTK